MEIWANKMYAPPNYPVLFIHVFSASAIIWSVITAFYAYRRGQMRRMARRLLLLLGAVILLSSAHLPLFALAVIPADVIFLLAGMLIIFSSWLLSIFAIFQESRAKAKTEETAPLIQEGVWPPPPMRPDAERTEELSSERYKG